MFRQHKSVDMLTIDALIPVPAGLAVSPDRRRLVYDVRGGAISPLSNFGELERHFEDVDLVRIHWTPLQLSATIDNIRAR